MRRRTESVTEAPGQDSFLDVVANLVGILIILIMVIGAQATDAMVDAGPEAEEEALPRVDVAAARAAAQAVEADIRAIAAKMQRQDLETAYRQKERDKMLAVVGAVEQQLAATREQLDTQQRAQLDSHRELLVARSELEDLKANRQAMENAAAVKNVIEHLPTPMAKTVFGKELHLRLAGGRLVYLPWDELVEQLKQDAPLKTWKLKDSPRITEILGPVQGFRLKYTLQQTRQMASAPGGMALQTRIELDRFVLIPIADDLGEPLDAALAGPSQFRSILESYDPNRTTVTVWVYPDSFNDFRRLKAELFRLGYATAGRPMPEGLPIGGSPHGSRSAAQ